MDYSHQILVHGADPSDGWKVCDLNLQKQSANINYLFFVMPLNFSHDDTYKDLTEETDLQFSAFGFYCNK